MKNLALILIMASAILISCNINSKNKSEEKNGSTVNYTAVTDSNYALAETQVIFTDYVNRIAKATNTNGTGIFMNNKKPLNPKDRTVMRINFDTQYSFAVLDLTEEAKLTMPETDGRYQNAWLITEEHYNPMTFNEPGEYLINQDNTGSKYVMVVIRTQVNMQDTADIAIVSKIQDQLNLEQKDRGSYLASHQWNMDSILAMRKHYQEVVVEKGITSDVMFGKKGEVSLEDHNGGTAYGWGGLTPDQAVYPAYSPKNTNPCTLTLKDVPIKAFWSITIYDADGYPQGEVYNINSSFAKENKDGSVTIHFGGDENADNYMDIFDGWNFVLRMYEPTEEYFNGTWVKPELVEVK